MRPLLILLALAAATFAAPLTGNKITEDGTYTVTTIPGARYVFAVSGDFGSGSLAINWNDGTTSTAYANSPATAAETWTFTAAAKTLELVLTGSTDPDLTVTATQAESGEGGTIDNESVNTAIAEDRGETLAALAANYVSVLDYGVVMDDSTESVAIANAAALQTAMDAATTANSTLQIPAGTLHYKGEVVINGTEAAPATGRCWIEGHGPSKTTLKQWDTNYHGLRTRNNTSQTVYGMRISNLTLEGQGSETHNKFAFYCARNDLSDYSSDIALHNVDITAFRGGCFVANCANVAFNFVSITATRICWQFYASHTVKVINCRGSQGDYHPDSVVFQVDASTRGDIIVIGGEFGGSGTFRYANVTWGGIKTIGANLEGFESPQVVVARTNGYKQISFEGCRVAHTDFYPRIPLFFWGQPSVDETVTIGATTYTWKSTVSTTANQVKIGTDFRDSMANLVAAINAGTGSGTLYGSSTTANASCTASVNDSSSPYTFGHCVHITNKLGGLSATLIAVSETMANARFIRPVGIDATSGNYSAGETVTIGGVTYTFRSSLTSAYDVLIGATRYISQENLEAAINASTLGGTGPGVRYHADTVIHPDVSAFASGTRIHFYSKTIGANPAISTSASYGLIAATTQHCSFISAEVNSTTGLPVLSIDNSAITNGRQIEIWGGTGAVTVMPIMHGKPVSVYRCESPGGSQLSTPRNLVPGWRNWAQSSAFTSSVDDGTVAVLKEIDGAANELVTNAWIENPLLRSWNNRTGAQKWSSMNNDILRRVLAQGNLTATDNASPKDLFTYSVPANTLANTTGESIELAASGTTGANADNKTIVVAFGGQTLATFGPYAANAEDWELRVRIHKNDGNRTSCVLIGGTAIGSRVVNRTDIGSVNLGVANNLRVEATSGTATAANITLHTAKVTWERAVDSL